MIVQEVLQKSIEFLRKKNIENAKLDAELLISDALKIKRLELYLKYDRPLLDNEVVDCRERIRRRALGEPVSLVLGHRDFWGFTFKVNQNVLTPRPETEELVEKAVDHFNQNFSKSPSDVTVFDLGSGTGCLGLTFLKKIRSSNSVSLVCVEKSPEAFQILLENLRTIYKNQIITVDETNSQLKHFVVSKNDLKSKLTEGQSELAKRRAEILSEKNIESGSTNSNINNHIYCAAVDASNIEELLVQLPQKVTSSTVMILSNPPYIAEGDPEVDEDVLKHEPAMALFAGDDGLGLLKDWSMKYSKLLPPGGYCLMEMGRHQGPPLLEHFQKYFSNVSVLKDLSSHNRFIQGII